VSDVRQHIRNQTNFLHRKLDHQYPYKNLLIKGENLSYAVHDYLLCFKLVFLNFLAQKKDENEFYSFSYSFFKSFDENTLVEEKILLDRFDIASLEYLFLGSRLGNRIILKKNPGLLTTKGADYFSYKEDEFLYKVIDDKFSKFSNSSDDIQLLTSKVKFYYNLLINAGQLLERPTLQQNDRSQ